MILRKAKDGGPESRVTGYWLVEWKKLFSVAILRFDNGTRDAYHSHAFSAVSFVLKGTLHEDVLNGRPEVYKASIKPVWTPRSRFHQVASVGTTWVLTFRGPWSKTWQEWLPGEGRYATLTHGRQEV